MRTITSRVEIDELFRSGKRVSAGPVSIIVLPQQTARGPEGRVLFVAGKRLGNAVKRNRCKRVLREAARRAGAPWDGFMVALIARASTAEALAEDLDAALHSALRRAGVVQ